MIPRIVGVVVLLVRAVGHAEVDDRSGDAIAQGCRRVSLRGRHARIVSQRVHPRVERGLRQLGAGSVLEAVAEQPVGGVGDRLGAGRRDVVGILVGVGQIAAG